MTSVCSGSGCSVCSVCSVCTRRCVSDLDGEEEPAASTLDLLRVPVICLILVTVVVTALLWVALDPILEPNLRQVVLLIWYAS